MNRRALILLGVFASLSATACAPAGLAPLTDADKTAIRAVVDAALKVANTVPLDAAAYVKAYYAADAIYMPPNEKAVAGEAAITEYFKAFPPVSNVKFTDEEIAGAGAVAYVRGAYTLTVTPPGAAAMTDSGKFLEIWKKQADGSWRVIRDAFNSDIPAGPPPAPAKK